MGDVEVLGVEAIFTSPNDRRGSVWIPIQPGLTALYGRNGAGKTTALSAVRSALSGVQQHGLETRVYMRLLDADDPRLVAQRNVSSQSLLEALGISDALHDDDPIVDDRTTGGLRRGSAEESVRLTRTLRDLVALVPRHRYFRALRRQHALGGDTPITWPCVGPSLSTEQLQATEWPPEMMPAWSEVARLLVHAGAADEALLRGRVADVELEPPLTRDLVLEDVCEEIIESRLVCFSSVGRPGEPAWRMHLAASVTGNGPSAQLMARFRAIADDVDHRRLDRTLLDELDLFESESYHDDGALEFVLMHSLGTTMLADRLRHERSTGRRAMLSPYSPVGSEVAPLTTTHLPIRAQWFERGEEGCDRAVSSLLAHAAAPMQTSGHLSIEFRPEGEHGESASSVEARLPQIVEVNRRLVETARLLSGLQVGLDGMQVVVDGEIERALHGGLLRFQVRDSRTGEWLSVDSLSSAQRQSVRFVLEGRGWQPGQAIFLADEIDAGIAERSVPPLMATLEDMYPVSLIATHSPAALRSGVGSVQYVQRDDEGHIRLSGSLSASTPAEAAKALGISVAEMVVFLEVVVMVEGEHDKAVFEHFLSEKGNPLGLAVRVVPFGGTHRLSTVETRLLLDLTPAMLVVVVDNARQALVDKAMAELGRVPKGSRKKATLEQCVASLTRGGTGEEQVLADLLVEACERNSLDRLLVVGLPVRDIMMAFDPAEFGLQRSWAELEKAHRGDNKLHAQSRDLKTYLRTTHNVKITTAAVRAAAQRQASVPEALVHALSVIADARFRVQVGLVGP